MVFNVSPLVCLVAAVAVALPSALAAGPPYFVNYMIEGLPTQKCGSTHIILSFLESSTPTIPSDTDDAWIKYSLLEFKNNETTAMMKTLHDDGTLVLASVGGAAATHTIYSKYDPTAFGRRAAKYIVDLGLDGLDIDLEGFGNDPNAYNFLKDVTAGAHSYFASVPGEYIITHAPEMPDFWHSTFYTKLAADREAFDMIAFFNVQMYNQLMFPDLDSLYIKPMYDPAIDAPTDLSDIATSIAKASNGTVTFAEAQAKLLLGFPLWDGSLPVGSTNLNVGGKPQYDAVSYGVDKLKYKLPGVFEWTAGTKDITVITDWNKGMRAAMHA